MAFLDRIQVFDNDNQRIGETYPRRAKQLVLNARAVWADDNRSIRLVEMLACQRIEEDKQVEITNNEVVVNNEALSNEAPEVAVAAEEVKATETNTPSEDLLMYLAKQNVARRYDLILHMILCPVSFLVLAIVTSGFRFGVQFYMGFYFAWGLLILYKCYITIKAWLNGRPRVRKVDLVNAEYERLKNMAPEKIKA